jgi:hypothetical protein
MVDLDDTIIEVHGHQKQGAGFGYSGVRGLNALLATASTPDRDTPNRWSWHPWRADLRAHLSRQPLRDLACEPSPGNSTPAEPLDANAEASFTVAMTTVVIRPCYGQSIMIRPLAYRLGLIFFLGIEAL